MSYKTTCPKCGGNDFYVTPNNGLSYCFHCAYSEKDGNKSNDDRKLVNSIETLQTFYTSITDYYHSCVTSKVRVYLNSRGYDDNMISHFKLGYIPNEAITHISQDLLRDSGLYIYDRAVLGDRIAFPYIVDGKVTDIRGRTMDKNDPTRYKSPLGSATNRGAIYPYNFSDSTEEHIVTEGEIKAGIASQFGFKCVALPGIASWRMMTSTSTFKQTIVFDSARSKAGREHTLRAIDNISKKLYNPYVAMLPLGKEDKMDIDTFIMTKGTAEFRTIINNALPYSEWAKIQRRVNVY